MAIFNSYVSSPEGIWLRQELGVAHVVVADLPAASKLKWLRQQAEAKGAGVPASRWF